MIYIGIDPGKTGAACALDEHGHIKVVACSGGHDLYAFLIDVFQSGRVMEFAAIEKINPRAGVDGALAASFCKLSASAGEERGVMIAMQVPFEQVTPQAWMKEMGVNTTGGTAAERLKRRKQDIWDTARSLFPGTKILKPWADAVLIAAWCKAKHSRRKQTA